MPCFGVHFPRFLASAALLLTSVTAARADFVTEWNAMALTTMGTTAEAPVIARDLAILHTAMYNASESIRGVYNTFGSGSYNAPGATGPLGASYEAAMISAASEVMKGLYGDSSTFTTLRDTQLGGIADGTAKDQGVEWGRTIAADILTWRSADGASVANTTYLPVGTVGYWAQTSGSGALLPAWGAVDTFTLPGTSGYVATLPGGSVTAYMQTSQYAADYNQVQVLGAQLSPTRDFDQTNQAYFWAAGGGTVKITGMWNQVAESAAATAGLSVADTARLLAAVNMAMADAGITAFATAYDSQLWRPETAIVNGDGDGNDDTTVDIDWVPLINSPSFPEYVALSATLSEAAASTLAFYLGDNVAFTLGSDINGDGSIDMTRDYTSFSQAAEEAAMSGIYGGYQFGSAVTDGQTMGANVAGYVVSNNFAAVPEPAGALLVLCGMLLLAPRRRVR